MSDMIECETIVAAAIYHNVTLSLPKPARHHTILQAMSLLLWLPAEALAACTQGFMTSEGRFVNRVEAFYIASRAGQIGAKDTPTLFSEDLW